MPINTSGSFVGTMDEAQSAKNSGFWAPPNLRQMGNSRDPMSAINSMQSEIRNLEKQLMDAQRQYSIVATRTNNPQTLAGLQSAIQSLQQQIEWAKQSARQKLAMDALKMNQRSQMLKNPSVGGGSGAPNEAAANMAQQISLLAGMFGGGMGAGRMW